MNIGKAIKDLQARVEHLKPVKERWPAGDDVEEYCKALELGIEALERITRQRYSHLACATTLLPGETKD